MPKNILICLDGTWNTPGPGIPTEDRTTNVFRFYELTNVEHPNGPKQFKWYNEGVGTEYLNRFRGGAFGLGLDLHIMQAYSVLIEQYEEGDDIYVVGFSRGAYTARSLVGLIRNCGLLRRGANQDLVDRAYQLYRGRDSVDSDYARAFRRANSREVQIQFLGVWDTVGALGIPLAGFEGFNAEQYAFHDTRLSSIVQNAFHALALDEHREPYAATIWDAEEYNKKAQSQVVEQVWFTGAHADIGGGYEQDHPISYVTLRWMQKHAESCGLHVSAVGVRTAAECAAHELHDSYNEFLHGCFKFFSHRYYRPVGTGGGSERLDESVTQRVADCRDYRPKNADMRTLPNCTVAWR